jgi:hypothetical protein
MVLQLFRLLRNCHFNAMYVGFIFCVYEIAYFELRGEEDHQDNVELATFLNTLITSAAEVPGLIMAAYLVDK